MQTRKCHADADANANADVNRIRTKNNMSPSPLVGGIIKGKRYNCDVCKTSYVGVVF